MGRNLSYCILFLSSLVFISSNPAMESQEDIYSQGLETVKDEMNNHQDIAERVSIDDTYKISYFQDMEAISQGRFSQVLKRNQR